MKLLLYSDLHTEGRAFDDIYDDVDQVDAIVLAGDIGVGVGGVEWANETFADYGVPVIYVAGNHEYYRHHLDQNLIDMKNAAAPFVKVLENEMHIIDDAILFGCTLWTDFELYSNPELAMTYAAQCMNDFRLIRSAHTPIMTPYETVCKHRDSVEFLSECAQMHDERATFKKVVVTHHAPHPMSVEPRFQGDPLTPAFASDLTWLIEQTNPCLWVHGHVHSSHDYMVGQTRVVANPRGYRGETTGFNKGKVIII